MIVLLSLQLQHAAPAAGRQAHAEALESQTAKGGPRVLHARPLTAFCSFVLNTLQILDPGAAARGKIKKHLKKQVSAHFSSAARFFLDDEFRPKGKSTIR
jgi:hypothetical protein